MNNSIWASAPSDTQPRPPRKRARKACDPCGNGKENCCRDQSCQLGQDIKHYREHSETPFRRVRQTKSVLQPLSSSAMSHHNLEAPTLDERKPLAHDQTVKADSTLTSNGPIPHVSGPSLRQLLSLDEMLMYTKVYFRILHPWHEYMNEIEFTAFAVAYWKDLSVQNLSFECLVVFLVANGSYFNWPNRLEQEAQLITYAEMGLHASHAITESDSADTSLAAAYIERTIYRRAICNLRFAWLSSNEAVHIAESMGLHKGMAAAGRIEDPSASPAHSFAQRQNLFWLSKSINTMLSAEYGQTRARLADALCPPPPRRLGSLATIHRELASIWPADGYEGKDMLIGAYIACIRRCDGGMVQHPYDELARGGMACLAFRRMYTAGAQVQESTSQQILNLTKRAIIGAGELIKQGVPWWKLSETPLQLLCVVLCMDTVHALKLVPDILRTIKHVHDVFGMRRTQDAYYAAQRLMQIALKKKGTELDILKQALPSSPVFEDLPDLASDISWTDIMKHGF